MNIDGITLHALAHEIDNLIQGARIDRITQPDKMTIVLSLRQPGRNLTLTISAEPDRPHLFVSEQTYDNPAVPPAFCMLLRKHLENSRIANLEQHHLDRILWLNFDVLGKGGRIITKSLVIELMGRHSNIILVEDNVIIDALRRVHENESRVRLVLPFEYYQLPPAQPKQNLFYTDDKQLLDLIMSHTDLSLNKAIQSVLMGFGTLLARELCHRADIHEQKPISELTIDERQCFADVFYNFISSLKASPQPTLAYDAKKKKIIAISPIPLHHITGHEVRSFSTISESIAFAISLKGTIIAGQPELLKFVQNEIRRQEKKQTLLAKEYHSATKADDIRKLADILMANLYQDISHHPSSITAIDYYDENCSEIEIAIDPTISLADNAQKYYAKYNKLKRAQTMLEEQQRTCCEETAYLLSVANSLTHITTLIELEEIKKELIAAKYLRPSKKKTMSLAKSTPLKLAFHDMTIWIGKNNYQNDLLTFKLSLPTDLWLHSKDIPGSHVILRTDGEAADQQIEIAAQLAAYFCQASDGTKIPIDYTLRKYVKKPSGAKPGFVHYTHQQTCYITPDIKQIEKWLKENE